MRGLALAFAASIPLIFTLPPVLAQQNRDYWRVSGSKEAATYIDASSIAVVTNGTKRARTWTYYSTHAPAGLAGNHAIDVFEYNCGNRQIRAMQTRGYDSRGSAEWSMDNPDKWFFAAPNSIAERQLKFVCWSPIERALLGLHLNEDQTPESDAALVFNLAAGSSD
jgi:surface-adhesin protein E